MPSFRSSARLRVVRAALALGAALCAHAAIAQPLQLDIDAQPLPSALSALARQAGLQLAFAPELAQGRQAPTVRGTHALADALRALLAGSGLHGRVQGRTLVVEHLAAGGGAALPAITVQAADDRSGTEGTRSYTTRSMSTATGLNLSMRETPQSVSVVTRQQMDDQAPESVAQVLERTPGITSTSSETDRVTLRSRGFAISKIQYDGMALVEDNRFDTDFLSDMAIYDRVEIVRGATGLLTGSGEPSAAINLVRKRPTAARQGHAQISVGRWSSVRGELDVSGALDEGQRVRGRVVATYLDRRAELEGYSKDLSGLYAILEADLPADMLLTIGVDHQNRHVDGATFGSTVPLFHADGSPARFSRSTSTSPGWTYSDIRRTVLFSSLEKRFANGWTAKLQHSYRDADGTARVMGVDGYPDRWSGRGVSPWFSSYDTQGRQHALSVQAQGPFALLGRQHELVMGYARSSQPYTASYHTMLAASRMDSFYLRGAYPPPVYPGSYSHFSREQRRESAGYVATRWSIADSLKAIVGARLSRTDYEQDWRGTITSAAYRDELTPYAGLVYELSPGMSAYASYTGIFKPQTLRDRNNALLPPELGAHYEAGVKGEFLQGRLQASAAIFKVKKDNLAELDAVIDGESRYKTVQGAVIRGYELELSGELASGWSLAGGFTRRLARDRTGAPVQTTEPVNLLRLSTSYRLPGRWSRVTLGGHLAWQSRIHASGRSGGPGGIEAAQGAYTLVHAFATYRASPNLEMQIVMNNLFDRVYYAAVGGYGRYGEPRSVTVSMKYRF